MVRFWLRERPCLIAMSSKVEEDTYIMLWPLYVRKWVGTHVLTCISTWRETETQRGTEGQRETETEKHTERHRDRGRQITIESFSLIIY